MTRAAAAAQVEHCVPCVHATGAGPAHLRKLEPKGGQQIARRRRREQHRVRRGIHGRLRAHDSNKGGVQQSSCHPGHRFARHRHHRDTCSALTSIILCKAHWVGSGRRGGSGASARISWGAGARISPIVHRATAVGDMAQQLPPSFGDSLLVAGTAAVNGVASGDASLVDSRRRRQRGAAARVGIHLHWELHPAGACGRAAAAARDARARGRAGSEGAAAEQGVVG